MIIRLFLRLFFAGLVFLILADVFYQLHLGNIANLIIQIGDEILLLSFALLLISGVIFFANRIGLGIKNYFSARQRAQRRLFFSITQHDYLQRLFIAKKNQLLYFAGLKRESLLAKNNKKQCTLLAKALMKELMNTKNKLPEIQFKHYQQAIKQATSQQQIQHLLELQREISALDSL